jgi:hypothetical protein
MMKFARSLMTMENENETIIEEAVATGHTNEYLWHKDGHPTQGVYVKRTDRPDSATKELLCSLIENEYKELVSCCPTERANTLDDFYAFMFNMIDCFFDNHIGIYFKELVAPATYIGLTVDQYIDINHALLFNAFNKYITTYLSASEEYHARWHLSEEYLDHFETIDEHKRWKVMINE